MTTKIIDTGELLTHNLSKSFYRPFQGIVEGLFGFPELRRKYKYAGGQRMAAHQLCANALVLLKTSWHVHPSEWNRLESVEGPLVIVANHPFGGVDSLVLIELMQRLRPGGWKLLSNHVLQSVNPLAPHLIAVDALGFNQAGRLINQAAMRASLKFLREGQLLGFFPARRVSHWSKRLNSVIDQPWSQHALKLAARTGATLACLHFPGHNSKAFLRVPLKWPRIRGLMLCREIVHAPRRDLKISLTDLISPDQVVRLNKDPRGLSKLRARCFLEAEKRQFLPLQSLSRKTPKAVISAAVPDRTPQCPDTFRLFSREGFDLLLFTGRDGPELLEALGRARETTFRQFGQGVGREVDITPEDPWYLQLVIWDPSRKRIAGAYRIGVVSEIHPEKGPDGFYLGHAFQIQPEFYHRFKNGLELSRSFVAAEYQRDNRVFPLLWKGLAQVAQQYQADTFYGSVTISNTYNPASRAVIVDFLRSHYSDNANVRSLVRARNPFVPQSHYHPLASDAWKGERISALEPLIRDLEDGQKGIPPLIRYYCGIGARFIAYHVESDFQDALYCLLQVNIASIPESYQRRFR